MTGRTERRIGRRRSFRGWGPAIAVAVAIVAVTLGGRVAATALRDAGGASVGIAGAATVDPPRGWTEDATPRDDDPTTERLFAVG